MNAILSTKVYSLMVSLLILIPSSTVCATFAIEMDVKCTVYKHSDDVNGDNVDVRIFVMGLKPSRDYTAKVVPDHNPPITISTKTDYEGILWTVGKIPNGEKSLLFKVSVYEGNGTDGNLVAKGDDDAPCDGIVSLKI
jgi:hypothetical protein